MTGELDPLDPGRGVEMYLDARRDELADETLGSHQYRLSAFVAWCEKEGIESLSTLTGRDLYEYRIWRRAGHYRAGDEEPEELAPPTLRSNLSTLRAFLHFAATVDAVPDGLADDVPLPTVSKGADVSDSTLDPERVPDILDYLDRYHYASRRHTAFLLTWHTGCRLSGLHALDLDDLHLDDDPPLIEFVNRPGSDTPLKMATAANG